MKIPKRLAATAVVSCAAILAAGLSVPAHAQGSESAEQLIDEDFSGLVNPSEEAFYDGDGIVVGDTDGDNLRIPTDPSAWVELDDVTVALTPEGSVATEGRVFDSAVIFEDSHQSTDTIVTPTSISSFESYYLVRDSSAPEEFSTQIDLPEGASLRATSSNTAEVVDADGYTITLIGAPWAYDASGTPVDLSLSVSENTVTVVVPHRQEDLEYPILVDPYYESIWSNTKEAAWCSSKGILLACNRARGTASTATQQAQSWYPRSLHNGFGDAFRHCYWNGLMTIGEGKSVAQTIATRHEDKASGQPAKEKTMDLRNNSIGRNIGVGKGSRTATQVRNACRDRVSAKNLWRIESGALKYGR